MDELEVLLALAINDIWLLFVNMISRRDVGWLPNFLLLYLFTGRIVASINTDIFVCHTWLKGGDLTSLTEVYCNDQVEKVTWHVFVTGW